MVFKSIIGHSIKLNMDNYKYHINKKHKEVSVDIIRITLTEADAVYRCSKHGKDFHYEKYIDGVNYRVSVRKGSLNKDEVITAYRIDECCAFSNKRAVEIYNKDFKVEVEKVDYYELFGVVI